jgi:hypothetical protein
MHLSRVSHGGPDSQTSKRWPDAAKMENKDANGVAHFLYEGRKITASGHETTDIDPGNATTKDDYSLETYLLSTNPLSDRAAQESRSSSRIQRNRCGHFSNT